MSHHEPLSPMPRRDELDRMLDKAIVPRAPADLAARIARDVPRMAQFAPLPDEFANTAAQLVAQPITRPITRPVARRITGGTKRGWMLAAGLGAMAASVASLILGTPSGAPLSRQPESVPLAAASPAVSAVPERMAQVPMAAPSPQAGPFPQAGPLPQAALLPQLAAAPKRAATSPANLAPMRAAPPAALDSSPPEALAAVALPAPAAAADPSEPPTMTQRGLMGPVLPQGYGYSGGGGVAIPPSAPIKMSGGPGSN